MILVKSKQRQKHLRKSAVGQKVGSGHLGDARGLRERGAWMADNVNICNCDQLFQHLKHFTRKTYTLGTIKISLNCFSLGG